uniref:Ycf2 N-terminal domain-containing protein n=1 Tax=Salix viminalis TaxID=40686 RepID=A0A6N2KYH0_SALVM
MDNSSIPVQFATKYFFVRHIFHQSSHRYLNIFIPNDFPQSGAKACTNLSIFQFDPIHSFVRAIYSIADVSGTPLTEGQIFNFEKNYCQPLSDINLSDSEEELAISISIFNSNMGLITLMF